MARAPEGHCHICGCYGKLTFEHSPPNAAFNDRPIVLANIREMLDRGDLDNLRGRRQQRGAGGFTLCKRCNSLTGHWYGSAFASWAHQGVELIKATQGYPTLIYPFNIFPLRVIKQVVCLFFTANGPMFRLAHPDLAKLVLNRDTKFLPSNVKVYAFYAPSNRARSAGITGLLRFAGDRRGSSLFSEVAFPPLGFVMTVGSEPPDPRLCEISSFAEYEYKDWYAGLGMRLPIFSVYTPYPGDYRPRDQVVAESQVSRIPPIT
jgi:hypothetical protein